MNWFSDVFFPPRCWHCDKIMPSDGVICRVCEAFIPFYESINHTDGDFFELLQLQFPFEKSYALMKFQQGGLSQKILHGLKYNHHEFFAKNIAQWVIERLRFEENTPDLITCVPLHSKKQKKRGFNQNHLFAKILSDHFNIPFDFELLKRNKNSQSQAKKNRDLRLKNENVFELNKNIEAKHILLIDDVCTTGSTLQYCAWELLKNKDNRISVLVMAKD